jgi:hypothetical protein
VSNRRQLESATASDASDDSGRRERAAQFLHAQGADEIAHLNGTLFEHLERTESLLRSWGCSETLSIAGFCHATYGTDGFPPALLTLNERDVLSDAVGRDVEALVYFYASCDRGYVYPGLGEGGRRDFKDRFSGRTFSPTNSQLREFVDLTLANEFDVGVVGPDAESPPEWLLAMFGHIQHLASDPVREGFARLTSAPGR